MKFDAYVSFKTPEDAQLAISKLNGLEVKKTILKVQLAQTEKKVGHNDPSITSTAYNVFKLTSDVRS